MNALKDMVDAAAADAQPLILWAPPGEIEHEIKLVSRIMPELALPEGRNHALRTYRNVGLLAYLLRDFWPGNELCEIHNWLFKAAQSTDPRPFALADAAEVAGMLGTLPEFVAGLRLDGVVDALENWMGDRYEPFEPSAEIFEWALTNEEKSWVNRSISGVTLDELATLTAKVKNKLAKRKASANKPNESKKTAGKPNKNEKWGFQDPIRVGWIPCGFWAMGYPEIAMRLECNTSKAVERVERDIGVCVLNFSDSHRPEHEETLLAAAKKFRAETEL